MYWGNDGSRKSCEREKMQRKDAVARDMADKNSDAEEEDVLDGLEISFHSVEHGSGEFVGGGFTTKVSCSGFSVGVGARNEGQHS